MQSRVLKAALESCTEAVWAAVFPNFFKVKNFQDKDLYLFALLLVKPPGVAENMLLSRYTILLALLTSAYKNIRPYFSSSHQQCQCAVLLV